MAQSMNCWLSEHGDLSSGSHHPCWKPGTPIWGCILRAVEAEPGGVLGQQSQLTQWAPDSVREPYSKTKLQSVWEVTIYQPLTYTADTHAHSSTHMCVQTSAHTCAGAHTHTKLKITKLSEISSSYLGKSLVSTVVLKNVFELIL